MLFGGKTEMVELKVEGMSCGHCEAAVKKALEALPFVKEARASAAGKLATVKVEAGKADRAAMARAIEEAGYKLVG